MNRAQLEQKVAAKIELKRRSALAFSVYGIYDHDTGEDGMPENVRLLRCWQYNAEAGELLATCLAPTVKVALKLEPHLLRAKPVTLIVGGRGSGKSEYAADVGAADVKDHGAKLLCAREFQNSISDSVHAIISRKILEGGYQDFDVLDSKINHGKGGLVRYRGLARNPEGIKSSDGFTRFWGEEAQTLSSKSLENLEPTFRAPGAQILYTLNPASSADPISQEHLKPYEKHLLRDGFYEDDDVMIIVMNWRDNPWFPEILNAKRKKNKAQWSTAKYDHVWEGAFSDEVDGSIIKAEWFDACIDAHKLQHLAKMFEPCGAVVCAHDPFDGGSDAAGLAIRHGSIIKVVKSRDNKTIKSIDAAIDWATGEAIQANADWFVWDGDGMGAGAKRQVSDNLSGKQMKFHMFRGGLSGSAQDNAELIYDSVDGERDSNGKPKKYKDMFFNNRSQYYSELARRCFNTWRCVINGDYVAPDDMISFDSDGIDNMPGLRSEICRIPDKPNSRGVKQIMSKEDMKKLGIDSPNESDSVAMAMFMPPVAVKKVQLNFQSISR